MAVAANAGAGLASFEKELICSICTEVLYQPLTILNCLHTFCGSCLKEWFSHQHRKASSSRSSSSTANPYSCPTCRAEVVDVQHNATVSNLLELVLAANPALDRSQDEKEEMDKLYKPDGTRPRDKILPKVERRRERRHRREHSETARDRQMMEEARFRSLRELENASRSATSLVPPSADRTRSASADRDERRQRRRERERQRDNTPTLAIPHAASHQEPDNDQTASPPPVSSPRHPDAVELRQREQRMSHQASLRSLVSASESGTGTGDSLDEARIMQEILDEGLLGDIDVDSLTEAEQDRLAERIAELYRQRHPPRSATMSPAQSSTYLSSSSPESPFEQRRIRRDQQPRSSSAQPPPADHASAMASENRPRSNSFRPQPMPPTSIERSNSNGSSITIHHRRQNSDQTRHPRLVGRSRHSSVERPPASSSTSNLVESRERRPSGNTTRTNTDPARTGNASDIWLQAGGEDRRLRLHNGASPARSPRHTHTMPVSTTAASNMNTATIAAPAELDNAAASAPIVPPSTKYEEPSMSCFRCNKTDIQYHLSRHCRACKVDLCMKCYREGKGCKHWYGFGHAADINFEGSKTTNEDTDRPHVLIGRQYRKPVASTVSETRPSPRAQEPLPKTTTSNPADRLQEGHFCDRCGTFANSQFWLCDTCNDGEWGFCKQCVQTHHCCTHPLLPVAYVPQTHSLQHACQNLHLNSGPTSSLQPTSANNSRPTTPNSATSHTHSRRNSGYDYLSINVNCDMCHQIIFPSSPRYHCPSHQTDYDICTSCYASYLHHSRMRRDGNSSADVVAGWRKCPQGHRMIILAFEADNTDEGDGGMRRIVKADLVGGWKMSEADQRLWNQQHNIYSSPPTSPPLSSSGFGGNSSRGTWSWKEDTSGTRKSRSRASTLSSTNINSVTSQGVARFPPDGGFGMRGVVYYAYWPEDGPDGEGELRLPRGAEVAEIEDVNGDWWSGVYAGDIGVFPFGYVREGRQ
ncbi:hypothetical protein PMZ80_000108 [Knufia obscura]|uniref:Uncharacterized protein n=1 Tax=Knufia obscura TaxID=1635080 RepID=A0ABR0S0V7_9EURO|nr:hypothetical protein PMZ80_000108 [Knufia obscura]